MRRRAKKQKKRKLHYTKLWKRLVTLAVIGMVISICLEVFFVERLGDAIMIIQVIDIPISLVLISDVTMHYRDAKNKKKFLRTHALQIISVIPLAGMFVVFKTLRFLPMISEIPLLAELVAVERIAKIEKSFRFLEGIRELIRFR